MVKDDDETPIEPGGSTRATSVESNIGPAVVENAGPREQAKRHGRLSAQTTESDDRPTSPSSAVPPHLYGRLVDEDAYGTVAVASLLPPQSQAPNTALEEQE